MKILNKAINKLAKNKLLLSKVSFSVYNLSMVVILNLFFSPEISGILLYKQGLIFLLAGLSRLGSDFYWVSSENNVIISKKEIPFILVSTFLVSLFYVIFAENFLFIDVFLVFISILLVNSLIFLGRLYQKSKKHIISLFILTIAPTLLSVPLYWFFTDINIFVVISLSMFIVLILLLIDLYRRNDLINIERTDDSIFKRLNFFPMIIYGVLNQNLIQLFSGFSGRIEQSALLLLFQRICSLVLWPQIFHMQTELNKIGNSLKNINAFDNYLINYLRKNLKETLLYVSLIIMIASYFFYSGKNQNSYLFISFFIILLSSLINLSLGFIQYQIGLTKNGFKSIFVLLISLIFNISYINFFNSPYISIALVFLFFHTINHISNLYILRKYLKYDR